MCDTLSRDFGIGEGAMEFVAASLVGAGIVAVSAAWGWIAASADPRAGAGPQQAARGGAAQVQPAVRPVPAARAARDRLDGIVSAHRAWARAAEAAAQNGMRSPRQS
jgi:hypothetical protein